MAVILSQIEGKINRSLGGLALQPSWVILR